MKSAARIALFALVAAVLVAARPVPPVGADFLDLTVGDTYALGEAGYGVTVGDFDHNGTQDLAAALKASDEIRVWSGDGDGTLSAPADFAAGDGPENPVTADVNRDGKLDLVVGNQVASQVAVLLGQGDGTFAAPAAYGTGAWPVHVVTADFDRDGWPDIATANQSAGSVSVLLNDGDGTFADNVLYPTAASPHGIDAGDLNGDGFPDIAFSTASGTPALRTLINDGDGTFTAGQIKAVFSLPREVVIADFDRDGNADIAVSHQGDERIAVFPGDGDGTLPTRLTHDTGINGAWQMRTADVDRDGHLDLATVHHRDPSTLRISLGDGDGTFTAGPVVPLPDYGFGLAVGDLNRDAQVDMLATDQTADLVTVIRNTSTPDFLGFAEREDLASAGSPEAIVSADFDGDGDTDLATANRVNNQIKTYENTGSGYASGPTIAVTQPLDLTTGDLNGDGTIDLAVTSQASPGEVRTFHNDGAGAFSSASTIPVPDVLIAIDATDLDKDADLDLVVVSQSAVSTIENGGGGSFAIDQQMVGTSDHQGLVTADFDRDGDIDVAVAHHSADTVEVKKNDGTGSLVSAPPIAVGASPFSLAASDFDGDGDIDIAVGEMIDGTVRILANDGTASFTPGAPITAGNGPFPITAGDLDRDGDPDIVTSNVGTSSLSILINNAGSFGTPIDAPGIIAPALEIFELDNDAIPDIVTTQADGSIAIRRGGQVALSIADAEVPEGDSGSTGLGSFDVTTPFAPYHNLTVDLKVSDGTATDASGDYDDLGDELPVIIAAGDRSISHFFVEVFGDTTPEDDETVNVEIVNDPAGVAIVDGDAVGTILDDDTHDFGDAPDSFGTLESSNGARHDATGGLQMGPTVDTEHDATAPLNGTGDGADEDGVTLPAGLLIGQASAPVTIDASAPGLVDAWIDFNGNGSFQHPAEQILTGAPVVAGPNDLAFPVPADAMEGNAFMRVRLSSAGGLAPTGLAPDGEVEDHVVSLLSMCGAKIVHDVTLNTDLECLADGLLVGGPNLTIDLGGHTITGSGAGTGIGVADLADASDTTITNGTVTSFGAGIAIEGGGVMTVSNIKAPKNDGIGIYAKGDKVKIVKNKANRNKGHGIKTKGKSVIKKNVVKRNKGYGITAPNKARGGKNTAVGNNRGGAQCRPGRLC